MKLIADVPVLHANEKIFGVVRLSPQGPEQRTTVKEIVDVPLPEFQDHFDDKGQGNPTATGFETSRGADPGHLRATGRGAEIRKR